MAESGLQGTVFLVAAVILRVVTAPLSTRIGSRAVMLIGLSSLVISGLLFLVSVNFTHILLIRLLQSAGLALFFPAATAHAAAVGAEGRKGLMLGAYRLVASLSVVIGPAVAFNLITRFGFDRVFVILTVVGVVASLLTVIGVRIAEGVGEERRGSTRQPLSAQWASLHGTEGRIVGLVLLVTFFCAMSYGVVITFSEVHLSSTVPGGSPQGTLMFFLGVGGVLASPLIGILTDRYDPLRVLPVVIVLLGTGLFILGYVTTGSGNPSLPGLFAGVGYYGVIVIALRLITDSVEEEHRAFAFALQQNGIDLGIAAASAAFGVLFMVVAQPVYVYVGWGLAHVGLIILILFTNSRSWSSGR